MRPPVIFVPISLIASMCFSGCGQFEETTAPTEKKKVVIQEKIVNGQVEVGYPSVVLLKDRLGQTQCTGSIVAPKVILTAAHCIRFDGQLERDAAEYR